MRGARGRGDGRNKRVCVRITSRSVPIREEPSRVAQIVCSQEQGHIGLVVEERVVDDTKWLRFGCGWMCSKDSNGFICYESTTETTAQKFWATEFDNRRRLSAATANVLVRSHSLYNARRTARQIREHCCTYRDERRPLLNLPLVSMENMMVALQASTRLKGTEIFEFIRIAASHQSDPHKSIADIAIDCENMLLRRPSEWVKDDLGVINTVDSRSRNDTFVMSAARDDLFTFEKCLNNGQELAVLHSDLQYTALHAAADFGAARIMQMLIRTGININLRDAKYGMTALHFAAQSGRIEVCKLLVEHNCDRTIQNYEGKLAYEVADYQGHTEVRQMLKHVPPEVSEVMLVSSSSSSLSITWAIPEFNEKMYAAIDEFGVMHEPTDSKRCGYGQIYDEKTNVFTINNLPPSTGHAFRIFGKSVAGFAKPSTRVIHFTMASIPEPPQEWTLSCVASTPLRQWVQSTVVRAGDEVSLTRRLRS
jgi:ankyrin repeat protein